MGIISFALTNIISFVAGALAHRWLANKAGAAVTTAVADIEKKL